ncbi:MAG: hypothetical protein LBJ21_05785, partial [Acidobacteriota bacterium]|nr:hypothetical protein [Acidobacteriota bacterium]
MLSTQKYADVLQEQAYKTLTPQIQALEDEMREIKKLLAAKIQSVEYKLEVLRNTELPAAWPILNDYLQDDIKKRYLDGEMLALFARELRTKETQEEILVALLDNAANCFPRIALFAVRGDMFKGWSSRGFSDSVARIIGSDEFPQSDCSWLLEVLVNGKQAESADLPDAGSLCLMREESSGAWRLYPLYALGRPVAILLAGEAEDAAARPEVLSVLVDCVALRLENVALKIIKAFGGSAPANAGAAAFSADPCFNASFVLSLNLTAPIEIPEPASPVDEPRPDPGALLPNPLAELKLIEPIPEPSG